MSIWSRVTSLIAGGAVATAASDGVRPVLEPVRQHAWSRNKVRVLDVGTTAQLVAQAIIDAREAEDEAGRNGFGSNRLNALVKLAQTMPGQSELARMLNREKIDPELFNEALAKHSIDPRFWAALLDLTHEKLDPVQLANAIHRGLIPDPGLLAQEPPTAEGNVKAYPVYPIPALAEAQAAGLNKDRLGVLVGLMGLPMGPHEAAQAVFRGILEQADFERAIAEGNTRNEWADAIFEQTKQIPTARDFFENALRGYHDLAWAQRQAKRHGMSDADSLVIYQNQGRPMAVRLITQALARGGVFKPEPGEITDPFLASIVEGNLKPAYYDLALANRYTLPSPFVMRALTQAGTWTQAKAEQRLKEAGWIPEDAAEAAAAWAGGPAASADPHVTKADTHLWNTVHASYKAREATAADVAGPLALLGLDAQAQVEVLARWDAERDLIRKQLSAAQIRKALGSGVANPATGLPWTFQEGVDALVARGYDQADATVLLEE